MASAPSINDRVFQTVGEVDGGEVGPATVFRYRELDNRIEATYEGGAVVRGFLVGTREGDTISFRYCQLNTEGATSTGRCESAIVALPDGRLRLDETWAWESKTGSGTSCVEEVSNG